MSRHTRRDFLKHSTALGIGASFTISGTKASGDVLGANDRIRLGVAGAGGRGSAHVNEFSKIKGVEISHLIDPDRRQFANKIKMIQKLGGKDTHLCPGHSQGSGG